MYQCRLRGVPSVKTPSIIAIIPAHMASVRFPGKILYPFFGLPMIEHVRRRALLAKNIKDVYVATCDNEIADAVSIYGGKVIKTSNSHSNGTSRIAEASQKVDATHLILLQGDEPLLLPDYVDEIASAIKENPNGDAWNGTGPIETQDEIDRHSFVKCALTPANRVMYCFRRGPSHAEFSHQRSYIQKILGIIAYRKAFLSHLVSLPEAQTERVESIEQMRIIENGFSLTAVPLPESLPSVNEPREADIVKEHIRLHKAQQKLLYKTCGVTL